MFELLLLPVLAVMLWMLIKLLRNEAVFVPLPTKTIRQMLRLARVKRSDVLYDLGAGDGRVVKIASEEFDCHAVGIERNRILCWLAKRNAPKAKIICGNFFKQDISNATVVVMYLSAKLNEQLKAKLKRELKKETRIVSASHVFKGWKEVRKVKTGHFYSYLYKI
jgi:predicted RNA methylase